MAYEVPPRDVILAATTPEALFGEAASDPRALRRAYAALVKAYRAADDAEVFQHVRALYEEARAAPAPLPEGERPAAARLAEALSANDPQASLDLLGDHGAELVAEAPGLVEHVCRSLLVGVGPGLGPGALDLLELTLDRPELDLHPQVAEEVRVALLRLRCLRAASFDARVPDGLWLAVARAWDRDPVTSIEAWWDWARETRETEPGALRDAFDHLAEVHPAVRSLADQALLRLVEVGSAPRFPEADLVRLHVACVPSQFRAEHVARGLPTALASWGLAAAVAGVLYGIMVRVGAGERWTAALFGAVAIGYAFNRVAVDQLLPPWIERKVASLATDPEPLYDLARAHGAWPAEVVDAVVASVPIPLDDEQYAYAPGHPLLEALRDPVAPLLVMTEAHVARVKAASDG